MRALEVLGTGPLALVQDLGRPRLAALGVSRSGAADRAALRLANRLLAGDEDFAAVEVTFGGLTVRATADVTVAVTGAPAPATLDDRPVAHQSVVAVRAGQVLALGTPATGLRSYLAVRGGVAVPQVLGSRSTDTLSGIGPPLLCEGSVLPIGAAPERFPVVDAAPMRSSADDVAELRVVPGPRDDWLADADALFSTTWTVSPRSNRVGTRLDGQALEYHPARRGTELPSEGVVRGAVQLPPNGQPVVFGPDHPVTGGYPVVAVVVDADLDRWGQLRPGDRLRLTDWSLPGQHAGVLPRE